MTKARTENRANVGRSVVQVLTRPCFCKACYESCATTSGYVCPLDGDVCGTHDVSSKEYPAEQLLRRKVHCWNEANGCGAILPASQISEHVRQDCQHHLTRCPNCSADVLSRDVCAHLKSRCRTLVLHDSPEALQGANNQENSHFVAFERKVEQRVRELDSRLAQLSFESGSHNDKLVEVCHNINYLKEAQAEQFGALAEKIERASVQTIHHLERNEAEIKALRAHEKTTEQRVTQLSLDMGAHSQKLVDVGEHINNLKKSLTQHFGPASDRNVAEIKALYVEKSESLMTAIHSVRTSVPSDPKTHQWVLKGYAALKEKALKEGGSQSMSDKLYLRGYLMSWGIAFEKDRDSVNLMLRIQLHKGRQDDFLEWPYMKELKLSIIHPQTREELHRVERAVWSNKFRPALCRPIESSNTPIRFSKTQIETGNIERDGYIKGDQLMLSLEVL
ncbi:hypothetical protein HPB48_021064 [Haemaphysalis longicornis]|uniref:MATH domain-containing protein n=1 Tax=Haemaphysalis longicornis TaxID=44386 RepID=A0A9J6FUV6_HAELO|nr:hypothetical protein HPB48_021064 [Haemaphysalis longicornis]